MAIKSPVTIIIKEAAKRKIPILGICNGFQILTQLNLLPGKLLLNRTKKFICKQVECYTPEIKTKLYIFKARVPFKVIINNKLPQRGELEQSC